MTRSNRTIVTLTMLSLLTPGLDRVARSMERASSEEPKGAVQIWGSVGLQGVTLRGLPGGPVSDEGGRYCSSVSPGWSGTVTPTKTGYVFAPPTREYNSLRADLLNENYTAKVMTFAISGNVGMPGVIMLGLPDKPVSDVNGTYRASVPYGWSGVVKPEKPGFCFEPANLTYNKTTEDRKAEHYRSSVIVFTISGKTGVSGVTMKGLPGNPVTDREGSYKVAVEYGWVGKVTPVKEGYEFEPPSREYAPVTEGLTHEDYTARVFTYEISGNVGLPGVVMKGLPGDPVSDAAGNYSVAVPHGWSGKVTPAKEGVQFEPSSRAYTRVIADLQGQDYRAKEIFLTISNRIAFMWDGGDEPVAGVTVTAEPGGYSAVTDAQGVYSIRVPYGWSGKLILAKKGFDFDPNAILFSNVTADIDRVRGRPATPAQPKYPRVVIPTPKNVLIIPTAAVASERIAETREDMQVMLQILREKLSEPRMILGTLYDYGDFFGRDSHGVEAVYLQGYGALFMLEVEFPFLFPPEPRAEAKHDEKQVIDPVWQRARDKLYAPPAAPGYGSRGRSVETSEMSFEQFQEDLLKTLRHAANLRHIEPNEVVILTIIGQGDERLPSGFYGSGMGGMVGGMGGYGDGRGAGGFGGSGAFYTGSRASGGGGTGIARQVAAAPGSATVLTIQAKKADIDAFAEGELDWEQFRQKVKTFAY